MDVSNLLGHFLISPVCLRPGFQIPTQLYLSSLVSIAGDNGTSSVGLLVPPQQQQPQQQEEEPKSEEEEEEEDDDEEDEEDEEEEDCAIQGGAGKEGGGKAKSRPKCIHRTRYSREEYRCESCPYSCTTEKAFLRHVHRCTGKDRGDADPHDSPLSCPVCGKDRKNESSLSVHMVKHKAGKHFCCDLCKFRSIQLKKIIQHRRMHTGEKPHLCPHCSYRSSRRDNLRSHVRRMHNEDDLHCDTFTPRKILFIPKQHN